MPSCLHRAYLALAIGLVLGLPNAAAGHEVTPDDVLPSTKWVNFYGVESTLAGAPLPASAYIGVYDSGWVQCGEFAVTDDGWYGFLPCYGDDNFTQEDEGASYCEVVQFTVDGLPATAVPISLNNSPVSADTIVTWSGNQDLWQVELHAPAIVGPPLNIAPDGAAVQLRWTHELTQVAVYEVWRSSAPHFLLGQWGTQVAIKLAAQPGLMTWTDHSHEAIPEANYYYRLRGLGAGSEPICASAPVVGEFNFALARGSP